MKNLRRFAIVRGITVTICALLLPFLSPDLGNRPLRSPEDYLGNLAAFYIEEGRNVNLDWQLKVLYAFRWGHGRPPGDLKPVLYIGFDDTAVDRISKQPDGSLRRELTRVLVKADTLNPSAVFADISMPQPGGEDGRTQSDLELLDWLAVGQPRKYPILLPTTTVAGQPISNSPSVCPVATDVFTDDDGIVRHMALRAKDEEGIWRYGADYALQVLAQGESRQDKGHFWRNCAKLHRDLDALYRRVSNDTIALRGSFNQRILFREWDWATQTSSTGRSGSEGNLDGLKGQSGDSLWKGARYYSAGFFLGLKTDGMFRQRFDGAVIIIGTSDPRAAADDRHFVPVGELSGADIHFHALMTLLNYHKPGELGATGFRRGYIILMTVSIFFIVTASYWLSRRITQAPAANLIEFVLINTFALPLAVASLHYQHVFFDYATPVILIGVFDMLFYRPSKDQSLHQPQG